MKIHGPDHRSFARRHPIVSLVAAGAALAVADVELVAAALVGGAAALLLATPEANDLAGHLVARVRRRLAHERRRGLGEGDYTAAESYDRDAEAFAHSGKVGEAGRVARRAMEGRERKDLTSAEREGRRRAAEEDRLLRSNRRSKEDPHPHHKGL
jgi:hypothetical protein